MQDEKYALLEEKTEAQCQSEVLQARYEESLCANKKQT